jgi:FkbM family methyltransferase
MSLQQGVRTGLLRPVRKLGLAVARYWPWPVRAQLANGQWLYVDLRSSIGRGLFMTGVFDPEVFEPIRCCLRSDDLFLDVGANVGYYSICALDLVGETGEVHAFEIDPRPLRCLRKTITRRRLRRLHLHAVAVSDEVGQATLLAEPDAGHSRVVADGPGPRVPTITLDAWKQQHSARRVAALKIDVEGGELRVLRGALNLLRSDRPLVVCEAAESNLQRHNSRTDQLLDFLAAVGYQIQWLKGVWTPTIVATHS